MEKMGTGHGTSDDVSRDFLGETYMSCALSPSKKLETAASPQSMTKPAEAIPSTLPAWSKPRCARATECLQETHAERSEQTQQHDVRFNHYFWHGDVHAEYTERLNGRALMHGLDLFAGRHDIRRAHQSTCNEHLPLRCLLTLRHYDVVSGLNRHDFDNPCAVALRSMFHQKCSPAVVVGDDAHYRCICMSCRENCIYLVDPCGATSITSDLRNAVWRLRLRRLSVR